MDLPLTPLSVPDPGIAEVQDLTTGELIAAETAIGADYGKAMALRMSLRQSIAEGVPLYACPLCGIPVYLVSHKHARRFFFRHHLEDGRCPSRTRGEMSEAEISARKYNGAKESRDHVRMKEIVAESLRCDPRFSAIKVEAVMKGQDRSAWRKPDVQAIYGGIPVVFEIQLSTTFLRVIAERRAFYQREGALLVWIFKRFDEDAARLTQDDIFYSNNRNLFLASERTLEVSQAAGALTLDCRWAEPFVSHGSIETRWGGRLAAFHELEIDRERQRAFLFDYDREAQALRGTDDEALRLAFEAFWLPRRNNEPWDAHEWNMLRQGFGARDIALPIEPNWGGAPSHLLNALYSGREGRPVGWRLNRLVDVAHCVASRHKELLRVFLHTLAAYDRHAQIRTEDSSGRWRRTAEAFQAPLALGSPEYEPEQRFDDLVRILFPQLGGHGHD